MFLFVWVGACFFGFFGLMVMVGSLASSYVAEYRRISEPADQRLVMALGTSFASFLIVTLAQPIVFSRYAWVPAALLLAVQAGRLRREAAARVLAPAGDKPRHPETAIPSSFGQPAQ